MSQLKSGLVGVAVAVTLSIGFAPLAQSHDELWHQLEITDGYSPSQAHSQGEKAATKQDVPSDKGTDFVGTGAKKQPASAPSCDRRGDQMRQSDGYNTLQC